MWADVACWCCAVARQLVEGWTAACVHPCMLAPCVAHLPGCFPSPSCPTDVDWVCSQAWAYCVLDEGHAIRNPASKVSQAAKRAGLAAQHRLLLSGTPVQNSEQGPGA